MKTRQPTSQTTHTSGVSLPVRSIAIDPNRAAGWLKELESAREDGTLGDCLSQLHDQLSDQCWLANWQREYVKLDITTEQQLELASQLGSGYLDEIIADVLIAVRDRQIETGTV